MKYESMSDSQINIEASDVFNNDSVLCYCSNAELALKLQIENKISVIWDMNCEDWFVNAQVFSDEGQYLCYLECDFIPIILFSKITFSIIE